MQFIIHRTQSLRSFASPYFRINARVDFTPEEKADVDKYKLGYQNVYTSSGAKKWLDKSNASGFIFGFIYYLVSLFFLRVTIGRLEKGITIESRDLGKIIDVETAFHGACKTIKGYIATARTFNNTEEQIDI